MTGMDKFEAIVRAAIHQAGPIHDVEGPQALILEAADQLLLDAAMDVGKDVVSGICGILLTIYKTGNSPGKSNNPALDELVGILLKAREKDADTAAEDTY